MCVLVNTEMRSSAARPSNWYFEFVTGSAYRALDESKIIETLKRLRNRIAERFPERLLSPEPSTASSPERVMTPAQLGRYLDYCSELLSVTSKLAALLVQYFNDEVVLGAVDEIEGLTTGLQSKIWQKIRLLERASK